MHDPLTNLANRRAIIPWVSFAISLIVFVLFFGFWLGWSLLPILVMVLIVHELGHYAAMRIFGYYQTSVFFIPGIGAAATGKTDKPNYWHRFVVYLAGPLPGIIIGVLLLVYGDLSAEWLYTAALMSIVTALIYSLLCR